MTEIILNTENIILQEAGSYFDDARHLSIRILRLDKIHPVVSGNKYFKLKYNIIEAKKNSAELILSFGGAFSNHIRALAFTAMKEGIRSAAVIRGEELNPSNYSLSFAAECGMEFFFVTREEYRLRNNPEFIEMLRKKFGDFYLVPEGGSNSLAVKGCSEIVDYINDDFDYLAVSCGTGGTAAGLLEGLAGHKKLLIFPSLKQYGFLKDDIRSLNYGYNKRVFRNFEFVPGYDFGGYAKKRKELIDFIEDFESRSEVPLDFVYTGKLFYGVQEEIKKGRFKSGDKIVLIHTGGYFMQDTPTGIKRHL